MSDYWDGMDERDQEMVSPMSDGSTGIYVNGSFMAVDEGESFASTVKSAAVEAGMGKFRVLMNGEEITPGDAPDTFVEGTKVEIRPYEVAG